MDDLFAQPFVQSQNGFAPPYEYNSSPADTLRNLKHEDIRPPIPEQFSEPPLTFIDKDTVE